MHAPAIYDINSSFFQLPTDNINFTSFN